MDGELLVGIAGEGVGEEAGMIEGVREEAVLDGVGHEAMLDQAVMGCLSR